MSDPSTAKDEPAGTTATAGVRIRRAPKYPMFLMLGAVLGAIATVIITVAFPVDPTVGLGATIGYFLLYGVPFGVVVGGVIALVLDRVSHRRSTTVVAEQTVVEAAAADAPALDVPTDVASPANEPDAPDAHGEQKN